MQIINALMDYVECQSNSVGKVVRLFFFSSRRRHTRLQGDWSSDVCSSDLVAAERCRLDSPAVGRRALDVVRVDADDKAHVTRLVNLDRAEAQARPLLALTREIGRASCRERV